MGQWLWRSSPPTKNIHIFGLDQSGKTTVLYRWVLNETIAARPTSGMNMETIDAGSMKLRVFDFAGNDSSRNFWEAYLPTAHAMVWVIDSSDHDRLRKTKAAFLRIIGSKHFQKRPVALLANKQDVAHCIDVKDIERELELKHIHDRPCEIFTCIATEGRGLRKPLRWLVRQIGDL